MINAPTLMETYITSASINRPRSRFCVKPAAICMTAGSKITRSNGHAPYEAVTNETSTSIGIRSSQFHSLTPCTPTRNRQPGETDQRRQSTAAENPIEQMPLGGRNRSWAISIVLGGCSVRRDPVLPKHVGVAKQGNRGRDESGNQTAGNDFPAIGQRSPEGPHRKAYPEEINEVRLDGHQYAKCAGEPRQTSSFRDQEASNAQQNERADLPRVKHENRWDERKRQRP